MDASTSQEKVAQFDLAVPAQAAPAAPSSSSSSALSFLSPVTNVYDRFSRWKAGRGLSYPGNVEGVQKEVKGVLRRIEYLSACSFSYFY